MDNLRWIKILDEKKKLDPERIVAPIDENLPAYTVEGINTETSADEFLLVYDCSDISASDTFFYKRMLELSATHNDPYPVVVFRNWEHERQIYRHFYNALRSADERKKFTAWFDRKFSIYVDGKDKVFLETDDRGINYLEYPVVKDESSSLYGRVYNLSFFELKKLFNVTGAHLFVKNVRFGLRRNSTGNALRAKFREYLGVALYKRAFELKLSDDQIEELKEKLDINAELIPYPEKLTDTYIADKNDGNFLLPENFWFYHNGISIYSYEKVLETSANQIMLSPDMVSVINGAQTLTNFFLEVENVEILLEEVLKSGNQSISAHTIINSIIETIYVKTIIICGDDTFVRPITHGLNTQIPILEESLLADSNLSDEINRILAQNNSKLRIVKDGQFWATDYGVNVVDFVKHWLTVQYKPGRSKNLGKKQLKENLIQIKYDLQSDIATIQQMEHLIQVYKWWDNTRDLRITNNLKDKSAVTIGKYGRNYFGSYVIHMFKKSGDDACLDDASLSIAYERFVKDLKDASDTSGIEISLGTFKQDNLSEKVSHAQDDYQTEKQTVKPIFPQTVSEDLCKLLNQDGQSSYSFSKTIADYLLEHGISIDYFRVISRTGNKCKEAFPFPNSTFMEIMDCFQVEDPNSADALDESEKGKIPKTISYSDSAFAKAIERVFPVFVVDKDDVTLKHKVSRISLIKEFSFKKFEADAEKVFDRTFSAFRAGDESMFPRSSDGCRFHVRPKAINAEDTFQFTNGNLITKRTFWANKDTVDFLIDEALLKNPSQ